MVRPTHCAGAVVTLLTANGVQVALRRCVRACAWLCGERCGAAGCACGVCLKARAGLSFSPAQVPVRLSVTSRELGKANV
jgi:hypothetical protein